MRHAMRSSKMFVVPEPMKPNLEITKFVSAWERRHGEAPTMLFRNIVDYPNFSILMNFTKRKMLLDWLELDREGWQETASQRLLAGSSIVSVRGTQAVSKLQSLDELPIMTHQPGDKGRYLTSAVTCLVDPETGLRNLGCYRVYVSGPDRCVIFMDQRTHGHQIFQKRAAEEPGGVPVTMFLGGCLGSYLAGAANIPLENDSYEFVSCISGREVEVDDGLNGAFPPAPADAEVVIRGFLTNTCASEGPFGEFKGYYSAPTISPVIEIVDVRCRASPIFPGLLCGKESGLTLMSLQNEILMHHRLRCAGFDVDDVSNPLDAFGEYLCVIRTRSPAAEVLEAAMEADKRCKVFIVGEQVENPFLQISRGPIRVTSETYLRRGAPEGHRLGICVDSGPELSLVEY